MSHNNVTFLDNHDMTRIHSSLGESIPKTKMAYAWLYTCRGIPQLYYGSEILMKGISNPDGWVRLDFPGGWEGDQKNAFTETGAPRVKTESLKHLPLDPSISSPSLTPDKVQQIKDHLQCDKGFWWQYTSIYYWIGQLDIFNEVDVELWR
mgnify:CR=1 FL=1